MKHQLSQSLQTLKPCRLYRLPMCSLSQALSKLSVSSKPAIQPRRAFSATSASRSWLEPRRGYFGKTPRGRPRMPTGGSMRGTTVVWGDYGLRMSDHDRRVSAKQLRVGSETIKKRLRGLKFRLYTRVSANIPVFTHGNEMRMGKGKGSFDYFATRIAVSQIVFEVKGELHEKVARDAFRLAAAKLPGQYEFVKKGDPPVMGLTKVPDEATLQHLMRPRKDLSTSTPPNTPMIETATATPMATASTP